MSERGSRGISEVRLRAHESRKSAFPVRMTTIARPMARRNPPRKRILRRIYLPWWLRVRQRITAISGVGALTDFKTYGILILETSHDHFPAESQALPSMQVATPTVRRPSAARHEIGPRRFGKGSSRTCLKSSRSGMGTFALIDDECHFVPRSVPPVGPRLTSGPGAQVVCDHRACIQIAWGRSGHRSASAMVTAKYRATKEGPGIAREGEPPGEPAVGGGSAGASPSRIPVPDSAGWY
jgi:hypothetical protein